MGDVKLIVLNNGLQLIGEIMSIEAGSAATQSQGKILVANPVTVVIIPTKEQNLSGQTKNQIGFGSFLDYSEEYSTGVPLHVTDVLTVLTPRAELVQHYNQMFSNIILPTSAVPTGGPIGLV